MDDLEAARHIDQALMNLPEDYPYRWKAHEAYGRLILGRLGLKPLDSYIPHMPYKGCRWHKGCKWWLIKKEVLGNGSTRTNHIGF